MHGHNPKNSGVPRSALPFSKICPACGRTFTRAEIGQNAAHWEQRRFCSNECAAPARAEAQRGRIRKADAGAQAGRKRARQLYPGPHVCDECGRPAEIHHRDGDPLNNDRSNIAFLCRRHHIGVENRNAYKRKPMTPERLERKRALARERTRRYRERKRKESTG